MLLFYFLTKNKTKYWGKKRQIYEEKLVQNMQETFHGIKEIKIFNVTNFILNIFKKNLFESIEARRKMNFIIQLPRMWLEIVAVFIMILIVLISLFFNNNISNIIPILAVFAAAAFRIIPSANRILIASQNLRYGFASAEKLIENITDIDNIFQKQKKIEDNYVVDEFKNLKMKEVSFNYKNPHKIIFKNMDFTINSGECIGVIGSTGIGKSTFVDIFCGLLKQDDGDLLINNKNVNNKNVNWKNIIGYVPQNYYLLDGTIKENIAFGQDLADINISKLKEATRSAQLDNLIKSLENGYDTKVGERGIKLSGGQRQRLAIARALYFEPQILIFDESTSSLDIETEKTLWKQLQNL